VEQTENDQLKEVTTNENAQNVVTYYEDTGLDYGKWSREYNMHFGYYKFPMIPLWREQMLDAMNRYVIESLKLKDNDEIVYDLGCGLAAPCRTFAKMYPRKKVKGVTIVEWQIQKARELNKQKNIYGNIELILGDYTNLPFDNNSADAAYALESACHCPGDEMLHNYLLPRECPRVTYFAKEDSMQSDIDEFIGSSTKKYFINIEEGWFERVIQTILYLYELPSESFEVLDEGAGYYISYETIKPIDIHIVSDALYEIEKRNAEIRTLPSLKQLSERISCSSLQFSIIRLRNAI